MIESSSISSGSPIFSTTRWTLVIRAQGESAESQAALSDLCDAYWNPVFRSLCREINNEDQARELAQEFFARLLSKRSIPEIRPEGGRFRSYLLGALKHFLMNQRRDRDRLKRGGGKTVYSLDAETDEGNTVMAATPDTGATVPDAYFDRAWALAVIERALSVLAKEYTGTKKEAQLKALKPYLMGNPLDQTHSQISSSLGLSEGALKVAIHRLRKRFRSAVHAEIAQTVGHSDDIAGELRYLIDVLSQNESSSSR